MFLGQSIVITGVSSTWEQRNRVIRPGTTGYVTGFAVPSLTVRGIVASRIYILSMLTIKLGHSNKFRCKYRLVPISVGKPLVKWEPIKIDDMDPRVMLAKLIATSGYSNVTPFNLYLLAKQLNFKHATIDMRSIFDINRNLHLTNLSEHRSALSYAQKLFADMYTPGYSITLYDIMRKPTNLNRRSNIYDLPNLSSNTLKVTRKLQERMFVQSRSIPAGMQQDFAKIIKLRKFEERHVKNN